jgi:putative membrane protein insertion efficiency factor
MCAGHRPDNPPHSAALDRGFPQRLALSMIAAYKRFLSPLLGQRCRFFPSCSTYAAGAIERFGVLRGGTLAILRLLRCQPLCEGGMDPVPGSFPARPWQRNRSADTPADAP